MQMSGTPLYILATNDKILIIVAKDPPTPTQHMKKLWCLEMIFRTFALGTKKNDRIQSSHI